MTPIRDITHRLANVWLAWNQRQLELQARVRSPLRRFTEMRQQHAHWLLLAAAIPALLLAVRLAGPLFSRLTYPMDVEWTEGGGLLQAHRLLHGEPLYPAPGNAFMPFPYPPFHTLVIAALGSVFGVNFWVGRAVSLISICGAMWLLAREAARSWEGSRNAWLWGVLAAGLALIGFPVCGGYYDLIRCDPLLLFLVILSAVCVQRLERTPTLRWWLICCFTLLAAALTKQTALMYIAWLLLYLLIKRPIQAMALGAAFALLASGAVLLLEWSSGHNFINYTYTALKKHQILKERFDYGLQVMLGFAPYLSVLPFAVAALAWTGRLNRRALLWSGMLAVSLPAALIPYAKIGGYINNFIAPVLLAGPIAICIAGSAFARRSTLRGPARLGPLPLTLAAAVALYTQSRSFDTKPYLVTPEQHKAVGALHAWIKSFGPRSIVVDHPFLAVQTGSVLQQSHNMSWVDTWWAGADMSSFARNFYTQRADHLILTGAEPAFMWEFAAREFVLAGVLPRGAYSDTLTDARQLPQYALKLKRKRQNPHCLFTFESGNLAGWSVAGAALHAPQRRAANEFLGAEGSYFLSTVEGGDSAIRTVTSPPFLLDQAVLSLRVGGGNSRRLSLELVIDGKVVNQTAGPRLDMMQEVVWGVGPWQGKPATLRLVDQEQGAWGHLQIDDVCLEDVGP